MKLYQTRLDQSEVIGPVLTINSERNSPINSVSFHPTVLKAVAGTWSGCMEVFELKNGKRVAKICYNGNNNSVRHNFCLYIFSKLNKLIS